MGKGLSYALAAWLLLLPTAAHAQVGADEQARIHFQAGTNYYQVADYEAALREYTRAHDLTERPQLLYNVYLCHERLGHLAEAIDFLERYLGSGLDVQNRQTLEARLATMRRRQAATSEQAAADRLAAEQSTAADQAAADQAAADQAAADQAAADQAAADQAAADQTSAQPDDAGPTAAPHVSDSAVAEPDGDSGGVGAGALVSFVVAGVGVVAFAVTGGLALGEDSSLEDECGGTCLPSETNRLRSLMVAADVSLGVAVVAGALGLVLALRGGGDDESAVAVAPFVAPGAAGAAAQVAF